MKGWKNPRTLDLCAAEVFLNWQFTSSNFQDQLHCSATTNDWRHGAAPSETKNIQSTPLDVMNGYEWEAHVSWSSSSPSRPHDSQLAQPSFVAIRTPPQLQLIPLVSSITAAQRGHWHSNCQDFSMARLKEGSSQLASRVPVDPLWGFFPPTFVCLTDPKNLKNYSAAHIGPRVIGFLRPFIWEMGKGNSITQDVNVKLRFL